MTRSPRRLRHDSDIVRAWAVQLATDVPQPAAAADAVLLALARNDPSPTVRLALASCLPALPEVRGVGNRHRAGRTCSRR